MIKHKTLGYKTKDELDFIDLTDTIREFAKEAGISNGLVNVQTLHTTTGILVNENEPLLLEDIKEHLESTSPKNKNYRHDNFEIRTVNMCNGECANGHAHCKASHLQANATINIIDGKIQLGTWQRIFLVELDRSRDRQIQLLIMGE